MTDVSLKCKCGKVQGTARDLSPDSGTHVVCYCDNCQGFARQLEQEETVLDEYGGTDIFQTAPARITITTGKEQIRCLKLTPKGPYRWYTDCCKTPIANTGGAGLPFAGMITSFMDIPDGRDKILGPVGWYVQGKYATKSLPPGRKIVGFPFSLIARLFWNIFVWKLKGLGNPSPFFDADGKPVSEPALIYKQKE